MPPPLEIPGSRLTLGNRVLAAPMCGSSKLPWRRQARRFGADLVYTEMVKATPLVRDDRLTLELLHTAPDEAPCAPQVCGGEPELLARAAARLEALGFPLVDLNMGCPVRKIVAEGAGAALLRDPARVEAVVRACARAVSIPVTVKLRSGWGPETQVDAPTLVRAAEAGGAAMVTIHGRVPAQRHGGSVDLDAIAAAKAAVRIPVVANGGIESAADAVAMVQATGCDAVMIGRGAHGRPWLYRDVARALAGLPSLPEPGPDERCDLIQEHLQGMLELMGPHGVIAFRKYAAWYFRDRPGAAALRDRAVRTSEAGAMGDLIQLWRQELRAGAPARPLAPIPA